MGCGPLLRRKSDCTTVTANLSRSSPAFHTPSGPSGHLVSGEGGRIGERAVVRSNRPSPDLSPWPPQEEPAGKRGTGLASSSTRTVAWARDPARARKGVGVCQRDARCRPRCRKEQSRRLHSFRGTAPGGAEHPGRRGRSDRMAAREPGRPGGDGGERRVSNGAGRKRCARPASKSGSSIRNAFVTSPRRPDGLPRTTPSTPRRSPGSPRRFPTAAPNHMIPRARRSTVWSRRGAP